MAFVFFVMARRMAFGQILSVFGSISTKTGTPPRSTIEFAELTKVKDGMMTSSPAEIPASMAAISSASVPLEVKIIFWPFVIVFRRSTDFSEKGPSPCVFPVSSTEVIYSIARPTGLKTVYGIVIGFFSEVIALGPRELIGVVRFRL